MRIRMCLSRTLGVTLALLLVSIASISSQAQVRIPHEAIVDVAQLQQVLERGQSLEQQARWNEAFNLYRDASSEFPSQVGIKERLEVAKLHCGVAKRYADSSYIRSVRSLNEASALEIYAEVLRKLEDHYVVPPDWASLVKRGTDSLDVALTRADFRGTNLGHIGQERIEAFRRELHGRMDTRIIRNRLEARGAVQDISQYASRWLGVAQAVTVLEYAAAAVDGLDEYSCFLTPGQLEEVFAQIDGNFVGLGVEIRPDNDGLYVVDVLPSGPASDAQIEPGDRIVSVDGHSAQSVGKHQLADMLRGLEGTWVNVGVKCVDGEQRELQLQRRTVVVPSVVNVQILDQEQGIGYFKISSFQKTTTTDVDHALWKLHRQGMRSLVLDVRKNPGGLLNSAVDVVNKFVSAGPIVHTKGRSRGETTSPQANVAGTWNVPLVVLIDQDSASASEIFAGAIRDHRRGTLVGQRSYGKGTVQGIFRLGVGKSGVRITTSRFYSPSMQPISKRGVVPHHEVHVAAKPVESDGLGLAEGLQAAARDATLETALQVARGGLAQR